jgi:hypothetical protein
MKEIWLALILGIITLVSFAQKTTKAATKPAKPAAVAVKTVNSDCADLIKICDLASSGKLATLKGEHYQSIYYASKNEYTAAVKIPGSMENFIDNDPDFGPSFHCYYKDYGMDGTAALNDFYVISKKISDCLGKKPTPATDGTENDVYISYKNCKVEIQASYNGNAHTWITGITITN